MREASALDLDRASLDAGMEVRFLVTASDGARRDQRTMITDQGESSALAWLNFASSLRVYLSRQALPKPNRCIKRTHFPSSKLKVSARGHGSGRSVVARPGSLGASRQSSRHLVSCAAQEPSRASRKPTLRAVSHFLGNEEWGNGERWWTRARNLLRSFAPPPNQDSQKQYHSLKSQYTYLAPVEVVE
jgi:hypothetical protein